MRVLLLSPGAYGVNGGIGLYNRDIVEAISMMPEVSEIVILPREIQRMDFELPSKSTHITAASEGAVSYVTRSLKQLWGQFDLVICGHINLMPLAVALNAKLRAPLALMVYGIDVWTPQKWHFQLTARCADAIWSISEVTTDRMNRWAKLDRSNYVQLPNAIHLDQYGLDGNQAVIRKRVGLEGQKVLMTLARLPAFDRYKGIDELLECLPLLRMAVPNIAYMVVGDGEDRARLEAKAHSLGVADHVRFVGYIEEEEKADYYRAADLFVMPGRGEGFGFVFLEALACGVQCVGSCLDGSKEALRDGLLGEIPDPRNQPDLIASILAALALPRAIPEGLDYFAWPKFCERVQNSVTQLTSKRVQ